MAGAVVLVGPLAFQQRFGLAVAPLLLPVGPYGGTSVMPDHGSRAEPQRPAPLLQPPAHVDVVAGSAELRIEPANGTQTGSPDRHVAARNVLRFLVGEENMHGATGRIGDALGDRPIAGGRDVGAAHGGVRRAQK